jgi:Tfp pilus assembly protein PilE
MIGSNKKQKGFSMVELLITGFVFSIIFGVATSTFVNAVRIQKYNMAHQQLLDQASYAMEYMARALRMAKVDTPGSGCGVGNNVNYKITGIGDTISFKNYNDECQSFSWVDLDGDTVRDSLVVTIGSRLINVPLNSANYTITKLQFSIAGERRDTDIYQPRVTIFMELKDNKLTNGNPTIRIQTTVSQRNLDEN